MTDETESGRPSPAVEPPGSPTAGGPQPIPDLMVASDGDTGPPVTDEDRHRYGLLLDRAAERGLLTPYEYELRLGDLASATTVESMQRIVTELPAFTAPAATPSRGSSRRRGGASMASGSLGSPATSSPRASPWLLLVVLVVVVVASLAFLTVYVHHVVHTHPTGVVGAWVATLSALRL